MGAMKLDQQTWARVFPWLDKAQDVPAGDLPGWLERLVAEQPEVGIPLREVLSHGELWGDEEPPPLHVPPDRPSRTGQQIGAYTIDALLAEGGMGEVWLAHRSDGQFEGTFAVKLLQWQTPGAKALDRFKREGRVLARLTHPHVARLIDAGATPDGQPFLVLEYIDGQHIDEYCLARDLSTRARVELLLDVLAAVAHAHTRLIIHRDIKPSNVLVTAEGTVKLLDFGIAKLVDPDSTLEERGQLTRIEEVALTPHYAAPEQILSEPLSTATDVYQLGVLMHVLLAGCLPPGKLESARSLRVTAALGESSVRMSEAVGGALRNELKGDLDAIVEKSLRQRPEERYATAAALSADLQRYLEHEPVTAREGLLAYRAGKFIRRYRGAVISVSATLASLIVATVLALTQEHKIRLERDRADQVTDFMTQIFKVVDPSEARGNTVTAREILDKSSQQIERGAGLDPSVQSDLKRVMAETYLNLGLYARAHSLAQSALESRRRLLGPADPKTLESAQQIGNILFLEGRSADAEDVLRRTLDLQIRVLGPEHARTLETQDTLVNILVSKGRFAEAEKLGRDTMAAETRTVGPRNELTLRTARLLANALRRQSRFVESEALFRQTAAAQRAVLGPDHPDTLRTVFSLGGMLMEQGRYSEGEVIFREVLGARRRILGDEHPVTADTMTTLAMDLAPQLSRQVEAEELFRSALAVELRQAGAESRFTTRAEESLANLLDAEHRYAEAESLQREVLRVRLKVLGPDNTDTLLTQTNLADIVNNEGHVQEAERIYRSTLEQQTRVLDPDDVDLMNTKTNLADVLLEERRAADAESLAREGYAGLSRLLSPQHRFVVSSLSTYARALAMQGRYDEATVLYSDTIDKIAHLPGGNASRVWYDFARLAAASGRKDDAFEHLQQAVALGYQNVESLQSDDELKPLRADARYAQLIDEIQGNTLHTPR